MACIVAVNRSPLDQDTTTLSFRFSNFEPVSRFFILYLQRNLWWLQPEQQTSHPPSCSYFNKFETNFIKPKQWWLAPAGTTDFTSPPCSKFSKLWTNFFKTHTDTRTQTEWWLHQVDDSWKLLRSLHELDTRVLGYPDLTKYWVLMMSRLSTQNSKKMLSDILCI